MQKRKIKLTVLADNSDRDGWKHEHGLALLLDLPSGMLLFDTGAGSALLYNLWKAGVEADSIRRIVLSHGHSDHTGGVSDILRLSPHADIFFSRDITAERYSIHPGKPVRNLAMPATAVSAMASLPEKQLHTVEDFSAVEPGIFLTGTIARDSFEDCGGPFYLDPRGEKSDIISDEIAMLTDSGVLIQGCCHAGIINTVEHCRKHKPEIKIRTVVGGLHLLHASAERLAKTAEYLNAIGLEKLIFLHCTGTEAMDFLKKHLRCEVISGSTGCTYEL